MRELRPVARVRKATERSPSGLREKQTVSFRKRKKVFSGNHTQVVFPETKSRSSTWCSVQIIPGFPWGPDGAHEGNAQAVGHPDLRKASASLGLVHACAQCWHTQALPQAHCSSSRARDRTQLLPTSGCKLCPWGSRGKGGRRWGAAGALPRRSSFALGKLTA